MECHNLLSNTHFGGQPGHITTDSLHPLEVTVKNTWQNRKVTLILFLDIKEAFPNAVKDHLIHNMRKCRLQHKIICFIE